MTESFFRAGPGFNPERAFQDNDHWRPLRKRTRPSSRVYSANYGKGQRRYRQHLYTVNCVDGIRMFMVADEEVSQEELDRLAEHCPCESCTYTWKLHDLQSWFSIRPCACCHGCLKSPFPQQSIIKRARTNLN